MNEYRVPELNIQNGVLKSLAFLFEYIGEMGRVPSRCRWRHHHPPPQVSFGVNVHKVVL